MFRLKSRPRLRQYRTLAKQALLKAWGQIFPTSRRSGFPDDTTFAGGGGVSENVEGANAIGDANVVQDTPTGATITDTPVQHFRPPAHTRLPFEIFVIIAGSYSSDTNILTINIPANLNNEFPWNFARVCSHWKAVANAMPGLWTRIAIDFKKWSNYEGHINLVNAILSRQPESLISLTITPGSGEYFYAHGPIEYITTHLLNAHSNRLRSLCFKQGHHFRSFLAQPPGSLQNLDMLRWTVDERIRAAPVFQDALSLRKVSITLHRESIFLTEFDLLTLPLPWSQLTHTHFPRSLFKPADAFTLLRQCVNLRYCHLGITTHGTENSTGTLDSVTTVITLPALRSLIIEDRNFYSLENEQPQPPPGITNLLRLLNLHNLVDFMISEDYVRRGPSIRWDDLVFVGFIQRCSSLKTLGVDETVPSQYMQSLVQSAPSLSMLSIQYGNELPAAVLQDMSDPEFLPDLAALRCFVADLGVFVDMLESRWASPSSLLREVYINLDKNSEAANYLSRSRVATLIEAGRNINLRDNVVRFRRY